MQKHRLMVEQLHVDSFELDTEQLQPLFQQALPESDGCGGGGGGGTYVTYDYIDCSPRTIGGNAGTC